jgi:hypothetical protein
MKKGKTDRRNGSTQEYKDIVREQQTGQVPRGMGFGREPICILLGYSKPLTA